MFDQQCFAFTLVFSSSQNSNDNNFLPDLHNPFKILSEILRTLVGTEKVETLVPSVTFNSALVIGLTLVLITYLSIAILEIGPSTKTEYCHHGLLTH